MMNGAPNFLLHRPFVKIVECSDYLQVLKRGSELNEWLHSLLQIADDVN